MKQHLLTKKPLIIYETSQDVIVEIADDDGKKQKRAIVSYPLMHIGPNKKNLFWRPEVLRKIAPMFRGIPFKYDLRGEKGSSHVPDNLYSPFYDVGWTYDDENGAWYDDATQTLWVKGEVTNPEVVEKLGRTTTQKKSELNYASMGVFIDPEESLNSITGRAWNDEEGYERGEMYNGRKCYLIPLNIKKALHVALTNDPADTEAELANLALAEAGRMDMGYNQVTPEAFQTMAERLKAMEEHIKIGDTKMEENKNNNLPPSKTETAQNNNNNNNNSNNNDKKETAQNNDDEENKKAETAQNNNDEKKDKVETAQATEPTLGDVVAILKTILAKVGGTETADGTATVDDPKNAAVPPEEPGVKENTLEKVPEATEKELGNKVNEAAMTKPEKTEMADITEKYRQKILIEVADNTVRLGKHKQRQEAYNVFKSKNLNELENMNNTLSMIPTPEKGTAHFADNVPEFGGASGEKGMLEVADMSAKERREKFGEFGAFDVCFNPQNASKYINS